LIIGIPNDDKDYKNEIDPSLSRALTDNEKRNAIIKRNQKFLD
jgi:hypothetical protein